jgi:hypothetical protein
MKLNDSLLLNDGAIQKWSQHVYTMIAYASLNVSATHNMPRLSVGTMHDACTSAVRLITRIMNTN